MGSRIAGSCTYHVLDPKKISKAERRKETDIRKVSSSFPNRLMIHDKLTSSWLKVFSTKDPTHGFHPFQGTLQITLQWIMFVKWMTSLITLFNWNMGGWMGGSGNLSYSIQVPHHGYSLANRLNLITLSGALSLDIIRMKWQITTE